MRYAKTETYIIFENHYTSSILYTCGGHKLSLSKTETGFPPGMIIRMMCLINSHSHHMLRDRTCQLIPPPPQPEYPWVLPHKGRFHTC